MCWCGEQRTRGHVDIDEAAQFGMLIVGVPLWIWAFIHAARHTDRDFERAGVAPRTFWLVTVVALGPPWAIAYLLYAGRRLAKTGANG